MRTESILKSLEYTTSDDGASTQTANTDRLLARTIDTQVNMKWACTIDTQVYVHVSLA